MELSITMARAFAGVGWRPDGWNGAARLPGWAWAGRRGRRPALRDADARMLRDIGLCPTQVACAPSGTTLELIRGPRHE
jgi:uncharacterized protein YjiS (DUF1127 family)